MSPAMLFLFALSFPFHIHFITASDPDPVQDFCVGPGPGCKTHVTVEDFVFSGIKLPGNFSHTETGFSSIPVNVNSFPGLNTLGMSMVRADFDVGGVNVPHYHPRATEMGYVLEGTFYAGIVDTQGNLFAKIIKKGEVMVFPRGMLHFQMNIGDSPGTILGSLDSQNPGVMKIPSSIFGTDIKEELLQKAFHMSSKEIRSIKKRFKST
ncbi:germin-like protein subfamily 3 member 2 [Silene latifolia]|uniref:germin-like protein subfamily 3 member 2 n=1 Tax=Silene latifolia TaxID=37657 RepID=UPI003D783B48